MNKSVSRRRRAMRTRCRIMKLAERNKDLVRLTVHRTAKHMYAQLVKYNPLTRQARTIAAACTLEEDVKSQCKSTGNVNAAKAVGELIARRALDNGIREVAFDRSGFLYHGRVKALADAAREAGLDF